MKNKKIAFESVLNELEKHNVPPGEIEIRFIDGVVMKAKFSYISEEEWKEIDNNISRGLAGFIGDLFRSKTK